MMPDVEVPTWLRPYSDGKKMGWAQSHMAYADQP